MKPSVIKSILKENKEFLEGKTLQVGYDTYKSLKDFGNAVLKASTNNNNGLNMVLSLNNVERGISSEQSLRYTIKNGKFDTVKIFEIAVSQQSVLDYSHVDFKEFGTTA